MKRILFKEYNEIKSTIKFIVVPIPWNNINYVEYEDYCSEILCFCNENLRNLWYFHYAFSDYDNPNIIVFNRQIHTITATDAVLLKLYLWRFNDGKSSSEITTPKLLQKWKSLKVLEHYSVALYLCYQYHLE